MLCVVCSWALLAVIVKEGVTGKVSSFSFKIRSQLSLHTIPIPSKSWQYNFLICLLIYGIQQRPCQFLTIRLCIYYHCGKTFWHAESVGSVDGKSWHLFKYADILKCLILSIW